MRWFAALLLADSCYASTATDLLTRYGPPVMQRFTIRTGIYGSVEYGTDGCVTSVEIAPEGYDRRVFAPNRSMDREVVSGIIDFFVPPYQRMRMLESGVGLSSVSRSSDSSHRGSYGLTQSNEDTVITRSYVRTDVTERELVATIHSKKGILQTARSLESHFGAPTAERFVVEPGIGLTATYDAKGVAAEIVIAPVRRLLGNSDVASFMPASTAERILDQIVPLWERMGTPTAASVSSGCGEQSFERFDNVTITRAYEARWVARRSGPDLEAK